MTVLFRLSTGLMFNCAGVTTIVTRLIGMLAGCSMTTRQIICQSTLPQLVLFWRLILPTTCTQVTVVGSMVLRHFFSRPWQRSWRLTQLCMCLESASENVFSCTRVSPQSLTSTRKTMPNYSQIRSSGSLTTQMSTESPSTRHLKATWRQNQSTEQFSSSTRSLDSSSWRLSTQACGLVKSVLVSWPSGRPRKKLLPSFVACL